MPTWYVVQVDLDETDPLVAKDWGVYHVKWYIRHHEDAKSMLQCNCRFWPEIHEIIPDGGFGPLYPVSPHKVAKTLEKQGNRFGWYQLDINLAENGLVGPFDFAPNHKIPNAAWDQLRIKAAEQKLDVESAFERTSL